MRRFRILITHKSTKKRFIYFYSEFINIDKLKSISRSIYFEILNNVDNFKDFKSFVRGEYIDKPLPIISVCEVSKDGEVINRGICFKLKCR